MKRTWVFLMMLLLSLGAVAGNRVTVEAWGTSTTDDEAKFLEDEGLKSGVGISDLWFGKDGFSFSGYYLPNKNSRLKFSFHPNDKWTFTVGFYQFRKYWDTSAGHETTPAGYAVADWFPGTNTIAPLSSRDELYTTRQVAYAKVEYRVTPLQRITMGFKHATKDGSLTPMFRGFTFTGGVPFAATAASLRNYDEDGKVVFAKANFSFGKWYVDGKVTVESWDNNYTNTLGTFGLSEQIGQTDMMDSVSTDVLSLFARVGRSFDRGDVYGVFAYSKLNSDPGNELTETGTSLNGTRSGVGSVDRTTSRFKLGMSWKFTRRVLLYAAAERTDQDQNGGYTETRTDYPAEVNGDASRNVTTNQLRARARFLFHAVRVDVYTRYKSRDIDDYFSSAISNSGFDKTLSRDLTRTRDEWREGVRASFRMPASARLTVKVEAYQQDEQTDLRDLTWSYYPGEANTNGVNGNYRLSFAGGDWQFYLQGSVQQWNRDLAAPYFDPIYDPTQILELTSTEGDVQQHVLTAATGHGAWSVNFRVGMVSEQMTVDDPWRDLNYQPVEYDLDGALYGFGGVYSGSAWSLTWDASYVDTSGDQSHDRLRGSLDFSRKISDSQTLVVTYRYVKFDESNFELDDYQGHFLGIGWRYQF